MTGHVAMTIMAAQMVAKMNGCSTQIVSPIRVTMIRTLSVAPARSLRSPVMTIEWQTDDARRPRVLSALSSVNEPLSAAGFSLEWGGISKRNDGSEVSS
jgi:hypothetical protein